MAITYTWTIDEMFTYPQMEGKKNVVFGVNYSLMGMYGDYTASVSGSLPLPLLEDDFTPYTNLTEAEVVGWVQDALGADKVAELEVSLYQHINDQITPPVVILPLPWSA
jgi:hypothetical protein